MRGKDQGPWHREHLARITPAYAGKRSAAFDFEKRIKDHPRVCGEKRGMKPLYSVAGGSPPRMRGKDAERALVVHTIGITPAYAGKRRRIFAPCACREDHPRVCGEKILHLKAVRLGKGSPPRMRGKVYTRFYACHRHRITPTYAGKRVPTTVYYR